AGYTNARMTTASMETKIPLFMDFCCLMPIAFLFDHLIRSRQHVRWNRQADLLGGFQIDDELELRRLLDRQIFRLGAFQDLVDVSGRAPVEISDQGTVSHQATLLGKLSGGVHTWQAVFGGELDNVLRVERGQRR